MKIAFITVPWDLTQKEPPILIKNPPVAFLWLSAFLLKAGHDVRIFDALSLDWTEDTLKKELFRYSPDIVGFSVFTTLAGRTKSLAKKIKEWLPAVKIIVGGYHPTAAPEDFFVDGVDMVLSGESDKTLPWLIECIEKGNLAEVDIPGLHYCSNGAWLSCSPPSFDCNPDAIPMLPYELVLGNNYTCWWASLKKEDRYMATVSSRGCPLGCSFCSIGLTEGRRYRPMNPERVIAELKHLAALGITHVEFLDATMSADPNRLRNIAEMMIEARMSMQWGFSASVIKLKNFRFFDLLHKAGCKFIFYGVESGNPSILMREKKVTREDVLATVKATKKSGIQVHCSFIYGHLDDTKESLRETTLFSLLVNPDTASYSIATPFPGTRMHAACAEKGLLKNLDYDDYRSPNVVFAPENVAKDDIVGEFHYAHRKFYSRPTYIVKCFLKIRSWPDLIRYAKLGYSILFGAKKYKM